MLALNAAPRSEPVVVGSILIGADDVVGEMVKSRIPHMRGGDWGYFTSLGVILNNELVGGVIYHEYRKFDMQMSCAFDRIGWARRGVLRALFSYPFNDLGVRRVTAITGRKNKKAKKLLTDLGFSLEGVARKGLDGVEDAFCFSMLREECKWLRAPNGQKFTKTTRSS